MEKTEQQKRFEPAFMQTFPAWETALGITEAGVYWNPEVQDIFKGFQLGEASALERAAKVCESEAGAYRFAYEANLSCASLECAKAIRALAQEVGK